MTDTPLYISDLDGTLLQGDATLSPRSRAALTTMLHQGLAFTVATARTAYSVDPILAGLPLQYPLILQNGAVLYDPVAKRYCHAAIIPPAAARAMFDLLEAYHLNGFAYCMEDNELRCCYTELTTPDMRAFYQERNGRYAKPFCQVAHLAQLAARDVVFFSMHGEEQRVRPVVSLLQQIAGIAVSFYKDVYEEDCWYLELAADTATKYHGVQKLREMYGFSSVTAFGDNHNDLPLFAAADTKIAVANATEELKKAADCIIGFNTEDAVVAYLYKQQHK